jgi:hypothetical protein
MAVTGGAAAKVGIRYERQWVVLALLDVLDGTAQSVQSEVKGDDRIDFVVVEDHGEVWHEVKHRPSGGHWTIAALDSPEVRVLRACWEKVRAGGRFALDSSTSAQPLAALARGAADDGSWERFEQDTLRATTRQGDFERLRQAWGYPEPEAAYEALKSVVVNHVSEDDLLFRLRTRLAERVEGPPERAMMALEQLVDRSVYEPLTAAHVWKWLAVNGIAPKKHRRLSVTARAAIVAALVLGAAVAIGVQVLEQPTPANPWQRLPVQPLGSGYRQHLDTVTVRASSLSPEVAQVLGKRIAAGKAVTGYTLRNAYPTTVPADTASYCLAAMTTTGGSAMHNGDPVEATACKHGALSQVWIPAQYEASGTTYTWLVNGEYPSMCLNANDSGGGVHQRSKVQLWNCYWPPSANPASFNESWDFGTWLHAMKSGVTSYPLFLGAGNFAVDADDNSLKGGFDPVPVSMISRYKAPWEYWY